MRYNHKVITIFIFLFFVINVFFSYSQNVYNDINARLFLDYYILESELAEGEYLKGDIFKQGFEVYNSNKIPNKRSANNRMLTLRSNIFVDSSIVDDNIYLVLLPVDYPCNIYLNGRIIFKRGNYKDGYTSRIHYSESVFLPNNYIHYNKINEIAFQLYPLEGETNPFNKSFITNARDASRYVFTRNFLGKVLIMALSFCGFVFFVFYLITYISRKEYSNKQYLWFSLMNLFFILSMINNVVSYNYVNTFIIEIISRLGFLLAMMVGLFFLLDYTRILEKSNLKIKILIHSLFVPAIILLLLQKNIFDLIKINNTYPIIILTIGNATFIVLSFIYYRKERDAKSFILFLIYVINLLAGMHDSFFFAILKTKPYALLLPYSVFLMNMVIFFILAVDNTKTYHLAIMRANELKSLNENLELIAEERTQKIVDYTKDLENANKTKDKFFSIIAHDLKNPFNSIIGYSEILKNEYKELNDEEKLTDINILYSISKNGYVLLDNLLQWAQSQTNQINFEPVNLPLRRAAQECIEGIENQSKFKDIQIINNIPDNLVIKADENLLKTILRNLLSNAVKYTSRRGLVIIKAEAYGDKIEISVKDTGIGISEKEKKDLFLIDKMHSRLGTNNERGSGLGLIICKEFVEKHGGEITVTSEEGFGTKFIFTILQEKP